MMGPGRIGIPWERTSGYEKFEVSQSNLETTETTLVDNATVLLGNLSSRMGRARIRYIQR
jgi:hypothetical protein